MPNIDIKSGKVEIIESKYLYYGLGLVLILILYGVYEVTIKPKQERKRR